MSKKYNFIVADDHGIVRQGVSFVIKELYQGSNVFQADNFAEIIRLVNHEKVDLLILDVNFPDGSSLSILPSIKKIQPDIKILIFSAYDEDIYAIRYINAGADGYLHKLSTEDEIKMAINQVMTFGRYLSRNIQEKLTNNYIFKKPQNPLEQLSNRELEIARLMVEGYGNIEICAALDLQKSTVSTYKNRIFEKLQIEHISELIHLFNLYKEV